MPLTDGNARQQATQERATSGLRAALTKTLRSTLQPGSRAGAPDITPILSTRQGPAQRGIAPRNAAQRSERGDLTECRVMLNRGQRPRFTPVRLCLLRSLFLTDGEARP